MKGEKVGRNKDVTFMMSRSYSQILRQETIVKETGDNSSSAWYHFAGLAVIISLLAVPVFSEL